MMFVTRSCFRYPLRRDHYCVAIILFVTVTLHAKIGYYYDVNQDEARYYVVDAVKVISSSFVSNRIRKRITRCQSMELTPSSSSCYYQLPCQGPMRPFTLMMNTNIPSRVMIRDASYLTRSHQQPKFQTTVCISDTTTDNRYHPQQQLPNQIVHSRIRSILSPTKLAFSKWKNKKNGTTMIRNIILFLATFVTVGLFPIASVQASEVPIMTAPTSSLSLAGTLWPTLRKLHIGPNEMKLIGRNIREITEWQEVVILPFVAFCFHPVCRYVSYTLYRIRYKKESQSSSSSSSSLLSYQEYIQSQKKKDTALGWYNISSRIGQFGFVAFSVYLVDVLSVIFTSLGFTFPQMIQLSSSYAKIAYTSVITSRLLLYKKLALCRLFDVPLDEMGQIDVLNRILNGIIVAISTLFVFDWLAIKMGNAVTGLFAFGSIGTLAFTLASQGLVTELLSGFILLLGNKVSVNDDVVFGDGTAAGKVLKIGWLETSFRGTDNVETRVPNTMLSSQKVSNVSRVKISQMKHKIQLPYSDVSKILSIIHDIKDEIKMSCPHVIQDSSIRPLRVYWTSLQDNKIEISIDTHHQVAPETDEYYENQQWLLLAISRALQKNNVELD